MFSPLEPVRDAVSPGPATSPARGSSSAAPPCASTALVALGLAGLLVGCSTTTDVFHRHYDRADYRQAERMLLADSTLQDDPGVRYRAGLMYADPASPVRNLDRAREHFEALIALDAPVEHVHAGRVVLGLAERVDSLESRLGDLRRDHDLLRTRIDLVRDAFGDFFSDQAVRIDSLRSVTDSLRTRLRRTTDELDEVREKLERFREVDLEEEGL